MKHWDFVESAYAHDYGIFKTRVDRLRSPRTRHVLNRVVVEAPDWVNVVARTRDGAYLMIRQIRHGIAAPSLEIPAGGIEAGESPAQAAARELLEETGYQSCSLTHLGQVFPNPAFQNNTCYFFLADDCEKVCEPDQDPGEDLQLELWSWADLLEAVSQGKIQHSLVVAALYFLRTREGEWS